MYSKFFVLLSFLKVFCVAFSAIRQDPDGNELGSPISAIIPIKKPAKIEYILTSASRAFSVSNG